MPQRGESTVVSERGILPDFGHRDPDVRGYYGAYGGRFVPETLVAPVVELERAYVEARADESFKRELADLLRDYVGRPTPLYRARRLSEAAGRPVYLKREDLLHTGAHKINNALGQALLARRMGKQRVIAETGAGQHGVMAIFYDAGKVVPRRGDLDFSGLKSDVGIGLRFHGPQTTVLRIEAAKSREGLRLIFAFSPVR